MPKNATLTTIALAITLGAIPFGAGCNTSGACVDGASKNAATGVCLKLPDHLKMEENPSKSGESSMLRVRDPKTFKSFTIWIEKPDDLDTRAKTVGNMAGGDLKLVASGDTAPNKGKFFHFHNGPGNYDFAVALVPGKQHFYRCEIQNTPPEEAKAMVEACKTVGGP